MLLDDYLFPKAKFFAFAPRVAPPGNRAKLEEEWMTRENPPGAPAPEKKQQ